MSASFLFVSLIWTGLLACLAEGLTRGRVTPHFAQLVWRLAALLMVFPWIGFIFAPLLPAPPPILPDFPDMFSISVVETITATTATAEPVGTPRGLALPQVLLWILVLGWLGRAGAAQFAQFRLSALKKAARPTQDPRFTQLCNRWAQHFDLINQPKIAFIRAQRSPFITGAVQPTIYLPESIRDSDHVAMIITHECVHLARGDLFTRPIERAVADLLWFSPFSWLARKRLDYWREAVCDAETIKLIEDPISYSRALATVARLTRPSPTLPAAALILNSKRKTLSMRISSILEPSTKTSHKRLGLGFAALLIATPLALAQGLGEHKGGEVQTFSAPLIKHQSARITSQYGFRTDPFTKKAAWHAGVDIAGVPFGSPIAAPTTGKVVFAGEKPGYGNLVEIQLENSEHVIRYGQLSDIKVPKDVTVNAGDIIGLLGSSGRSNGAHLHFEYLVDGKPYDPEEVEGLVLFAGK